MASFVLLGTLGLVVADPDRAEGQTAVRLVQTSPLWKRTANRTASREEFLRFAETLGLGDLQAAGRTYPASARRDLNVVLIFAALTFSNSSAAVARWLPGVLVAASHFKVWTLDFGL